jgi:AcrR family transcriptional regulator
MNARSAKPPAKASRPYRSTLRVQGAADTRASILATAMRLFLDHGYGKVTVADIAREANLALPTVYASTGGKSAILSTLIDEAMRDPVVDQTLSAIRESRSPHDVIRVTAHGVRVDNERYHDIVQVMTTAATIDEAAADILVRSDDGYRQALGHAARRLKQLHALKRGLTKQLAIDILWFHFGHQAWHLFVHDQHWSWDDTERWLSEQAFAALIE